MPLTLSEPTGQTTVAAGPVPLANPVKFTEQRTLLEGILFSSDSH